MKRLFTLLLIVYATYPLSAAEPPRLSLRQIVDTHELIKPQTGEWKWADIPWMLSMKEARAKAIETGRPILVALCAQGSLAGCL